MLRKLKEVKQEIQALLADRIIPFWLDRAVDAQYGGYLTSFDENGRFDGNGVKYMVTQSRMLWGFSYLAPFAHPEDRPRMKAAADQGFEFFKKYFFDPVYGGVYWMLNRDGSVADPAKLVYGEGFAIYALAQYAITYQSEEALTLAESVFDLLQKYCADTRFGGYFENVERDFSLSPAGEYAGDRKSLDIHMHLLEAFTALYQASSKEIHRRKLKEVLDVITDHMVDREHGFGFNQFRTDFTRIPAIAIKRTWNAERETNEAIAERVATSDAVAGSGQGMVAELRGHDRSAERLAHVRRGANARRLPERLDLRARQFHEYGAGRKPADALGFRRTAGIQSWQSVEGHLSHRPRAGCLH